VKGSTTSTSTINRDLALFSAALGRLVCLGALDKNVAKAVRRGREPVRARPVLSQEETKRLVEAAAPHLRVFLIAALCTGARPSELMALRWRDVCFDAPGTITVFRQKVQLGDTLRGAPQLPAAAFEPDTGGVHDDLAPCFFGDPGECLSQRRRLEVEGDSDYRHFMRGGDRDPRRAAQALDQHAHVRVGHAEIEWKLAFEARRPVHLAVVRCGSEGLRLVAGSSVVGGGGLQDSACGCLRRGTAGPHSSHEDVPGRRSTSRHLRITKRIRSRAVGVARVPSP
jgi:hypothetical protein